MKSPSVHIIRLVTFLVALQILNMGCFAQEFEPITTSSVTPATNIINTIDEYIAAVVLDNKDAVPEAKEHSKKDIQIHKHVILKLIDLSKPAVVCNSLKDFSSHSSGFSNIYHYQFFQDITPPPQKQ